MPSTPDKPVLITGASGNLGRFLARTLAAEGWTLRLTDMVPFPDALPERASFRRIDLADALEVVRLVEGCGLVLHFGGASTDEWAFESVVDANLRGLYHVYEGARLAKARVVFASSNHAIGFHERSETLDADCSLLPDSLYGASKAFGEVLARLYWLKHQVETVLVRIGSCFPEPVDERMLSTWLSYPDLGRMMIACGTAPAVGCSLLWGASNNSRSFWGKDDRKAIGWAPQDSADTFANAVLGKVSGDPVAEKYQGGIYTARG
ncbi:MAG: NAD(P)-dependent oxidoreductase [Acetobacteraceae bacterium]|nr:NAD(P)-dependent oxidoreductase [Acetobacteraceae bacterium]